MISPLDAWIARATGISGPDPARLAAWQRARLSALVERARKKSPFYAERLGHVSGDLRSPSDIGAIAYTTPEDVRANSTHMLCVSPDDVERVVTLSTSGTSGPPKRLFFAVEDLEGTLDFFRAGMASFTGPEDVALILLPGRTPNGASRLLEKALADIGVQAFWGPQPFDAQTSLHLARREAVTCLGALPSRLEALLRLGLESGAWPDTVTKALVSGEPLSGDVRRLAASLGVEVFDHYGLTETCYGGGLECRAHHGYHMREADLYVEIIDPVTGDVLEDGLEGEVVISTLSLRAMPLIRYRTGDAARMLPGPCPCGSALRRLGPIVGRIRQGADGFRVVSPRKGMDNAL